MNEQLFQLVNQYAGHSVWLDGAMIFLADYTPEVFALFLLMLWFSSKKDKDVLEKNQRTALYTVITILISFLCNQVIHHLYWHPRPFMAHAVNQLIPHAADSSFVSDHTILAFSVAGMFYYRQVRYRWAVMVLAALTGIARVFVGVHYPADVVGGAVVALLVALLVSKSAGILEPLIHKIFQLYAACTNRVPVLSAYRVYSTKQKKLYSEL
ncbi:undecaprenyl-diphosphatase [Brevibacillus ginsengisoli]|uniref:undecaprenyl-diphosphatase n=1 Tax=Brevibacillus ginsengisoli TaxID=363854 RepID=UPI003CEA46BA